MQLEGKPVQRQTVVAWLNCAYTRILDSVFEEQEEDVRRTVSGLSQLLAFADASASCRIWTLWCS